MYEDLWGAAKTGSNKLIPLESRECLKLII